MYLFNLFIFLLVQIDNIFGVLIGEKYDTHMLRNNPCTIGRKVVQITNGVSYRHVYVYFLLANVLIMFYCRL